MALCAAVELGVGDGLPGKGFGSVVQGAVKTGGLRGESVVVIDEARDGGEENGHGGQQADSPYCKRGRSPATLWRQAVHDPR